MLDRVVGPASGNAYVTMAQAGERIAGGDSAMASLKHWVETYLMAAHPGLGRAGAVCPFTKRAARLDTVRLAICEAAPDDEAAAFAVVRRAFAELDSIPCRPPMRHFRTVIIGFPHCDDAEGIAMLARGFMHGGNDAPGLWNPAFRPLRAPLPVLAVRHLVEQDAPFAARHPLLLAPFLLRFPIAGPKRLFAYARARRV